MKFYSIFFGLLLSLSLTSAKTFQNYRLVRILPNTLDDIKFLKELEENSNIDVWSSKNFYMDALFSPNDFALHKDKLGNYTVLNDNIQNVIDEEKKSIQRPKRFSGSSRLNGITTKFATYTEILDFIETLAQSYPNYISTYNIGYSFEKRVLKVIKFNADVKRTKRAIWIDCGIHAREWIAVSTCVWIINSLVNDYNNGDSNVKSLLDTYEIHIMPVNNPDGYTYSQKSPGTRLWRKNRRYNGDSTECIGVDLNRNFGYKWMAGGSSSNPCSDTYAGTAANSETETQAVQKALQALSGKWDAFLTLHTYGQFWLTPWGWTSALPADYRDLERKANVGTAAIKKVYGTEFLVGSSTNKLSIASGGSDDWAKGVMNIKYSYTLELRPSFYGTDSYYGFILPADRIPKAGEETYRGILAFLNAIKS